MTRRKDVDEEVELGEDITASVHVHPTPGMVVSVRLSKEEAVQVQQLARVLGRTISDITRESLRAMLAGGASSLLTRGWTATSNLGTSVTVYAPPQGSVTSAPQPTVREAYSTLNAVS